MLGADYSAAKVSIEKAITARKVIMKGSLDDGSLYYGFELNVDGTSLKVYDYKSNPNEIDWNGQFNTYNLKP